MECVCKAYFVERELFMPIIKTFHDTEYVNISNNIIYYQKNFQKKINSIQQLKK